MAVKRLVSDAARCTTGSPRGAFSKIVVDRRMTRYDWADDEVGAVVSGWALARAAASIVMTTRSSARYLRFGVGTEGVRENDVRGAVA